MTIKTKSQFYYTDNITNENFRLPFSEGGPELNAEVRIGNWSPGELADRIAFALNEVGDNAYTVSVDRVTRKYTISADGVFELLFDTGSTAGSSIHPVIGFGDLDLTGASTYTSQLEAGHVYRPQIPLQDFQDSQNYREAVSSSVNESASGVIETISFGTRLFYEFRITYVTDKNTGKGSIWDNNSNAVNELREFLIFATSKSDMEFAKDRDAPGDFDIVLLESTTSSRDGVGFKIQEMINNGLDGFFDSGRLRFRVTG